MAVNERTAPDTSLYKRSDAPSGTKPGDEFLGVPVISVSAAGVRVCESRSIDNCGPCQLNGWAAKKECQNPIR